MVKHQVRKRATLPNVDPDHFEDYDVCFTLFFPLKGIAIYDAFQNFRLDLIGRVVDTTTTAVETGELKGQFEFIETKESAHEDEDGGRTILMHFHADLAVARHLVETLTSLDLMGSGAIICKNEEIVKEMSSFATKHPHVITQAQFAADMAKA